LRKLVSRSFLLVLTAALVALSALAGCDLLSQQGFTLPAATLSGTVYLDPADTYQFSGTVNGFVILDDDTDSSNGDLFEAAISVTDPNLNGSAAAPYILADVPAGTYYLYAYLDNDSTAGMQFDNGDGYGYYGRNGFSGVPTDAAAVMIVVPETGWYSFDMYMSAPVP
jgi:hypothetical protein